MGKPEFMKGMEVEVCSDDQGLRGAWFLATILRSLPRKKQVLVQYHTLMAEESTTKPLKEFVEVVNIRPIAPRETDMGFNMSDEVDAAHNDGWWEGIVIKVLDYFRYLVYFRTGKEEHVFERSELRIHREWVHGKWVPPMEEEKAEEEKVENQDVNAEHNHVDVISGHFMHHLHLDQHECRRSGKNWHCSLMASSGKVYCEKHQAEQNNYNKRRRKSYSTKQSPFAMDPLFPSAQHQCRRTGKGWRCPETASSGKLYCEKHQLEQNIQNVKRRKGKREQNIFVGSGCDEIKSLNGYRSTGLKRTRGEEDGKKQSTQALSSTVEDHQPFSLYLEKSDSPMNGGIENEAANGDLTIAQIDRRQMLSPTSEEHQSCSPSYGRSSSPYAEDTFGNHESFFRGNTDDRPKPIEIISPSHITTENIEHHERIRYSIDVTTGDSSHTTQNECTLAPRNQSGNLNEASEGKDMGDMLGFVHLMERTVETHIDDNGCSLDDRLKTAEREFKDEKQKFDEMKESITRSSIQLQVLITDIKMKAEQVLEL